MTRSLKGIGITSLVGVEMVGAGIEITLRVHKDAVEIARTLPEVFGVVSRAVEYGLMGLAMIGTSYLSYVAVKATDEYFLNRRQ